MPSGAPQTSARPLKPALVREAKGDPQPSAGSTGLGRLTAEAARLGTHKVASPEKVGAVPARVLNPPAGIHPALRQLGPPPPTGVGTQATPKGKEPPTDRADPSGCLPGTEAPARPEGPLQKAP